MTPPDPTDDQDLLDQPLTIGERIIDLANGVAYEWNGQRLIPVGPRTTGGWL